MGSTRKTRSISTTADTIRGALSGAKGRRKPGKPATEKPAPARKKGKGDYAGRVTTLTVGREVGELARRLAIALALRDGQVPALSVVVGEALELLQKNLQRKGILIPEKGRVRSGPSR